jgi:hypothetical protein
MMPARYISANTSMMPEPQMLQHLTQVPQNVTMTMPTITGTANVTIPAPQPGLQPSDLLRPLPSIVSTAPVNVSAPCSAVSDWVGRNPLLGVGILAGLAWLVFGKKEN